MSTFRKWFVIIALAIVVVGCLSVSVIMSPWYRHNQMKSVAFKWCDLAPISILDDREFEITGNIFTRGCEWDFIVSPESIPDWIKRSNGLNSAKEIKVYTENHKIYIVSPQGGACFGSVEIYANTGQIRIVTFWS